MSRLIEYIHRMGKEGIHPLGWDRIKQSAYVVIARGPCHPEQAPGVAASLRHLQVALGIQERWALGKEHRERPYRGVGHGIGRIIACTFIRKLLNGRTEGLYKPIEA